MPHPPNYSYQKASLARVGRPVIAASARRQRQFASQWKTSPLSERSVHGCGLGMSASTAMTFGAYTRAIAFHDDAACGSLIDR
jgi:hypothetical protein